MPPTTSQAPLDEASTAVLSGIRDARFAIRLICPHCHGRRVIRWGCFSGRQRYRCDTCERTFSDLTGTALAYSKRLSSWRDYLLRFRTAEPLRRTAAALEIHVSTAFRWRHRVLASSRQVEAQMQLRGNIEMCDVLFALSRKGMAMPPGVGRKRGARFTSAWFTVPHIHLLLARDRLGVADAFQLQAAVVSATELAWYFSRRVERDSMILLGGRSWGPFAAAARSCASQFLAVSSHGQSEQNRFRHIRNVFALRQRLMNWLLRFRGVATHYLANYCAWHRMVDGDSADAWLHGCFGHVGPPRTLPP
jgi:transposase-like protein